MLSYLLSQFLIKVTTSITIKKQANLTGCPTTLEYKRSFQPQFGHVRPYFGPQISFLEVSALLDIRHCTKLQPCAISRKTNDANLRKWQKP